MEDIFIGEIKSGWLEFDVKFFNLSKMKLNSSLNRNIEWATIQDNRILQEQAEKKMNKKFSRVWKFHVSKSINVWSSSLYGK
jgi:hypothetical protein